MAIAIQRSTIGEKWTVLTVSGRLDTESAPELAEACRAELHEKVSLALELSALTYVSSTGLRVFLGVAKEVGPLGARMVLVNPQAMVRETLDISGFSRFLPVVASLQALA